MTEYSGPSNENFYHSKFIRVGERIYVTSPDDTKTEHIALAQQDGIIENIAAQAGRDPKLVDAGMVTIVRDAEKFGGWQITVNGQSLSLKLPLVEEARDMSIAVFEAKSPGFSVKKI